MSDDIDTTLTEDTSPPPATPADADDRWVVRKVGQAERDGAVAAARRARQTVGEWLGEAIRAKIAAERGEGPGEVLPPQAQLPAVIEPGIKPLGHMTIEEVGHAVEIMCQLATASEKKPPRRFVAQVNRLLSDRIERATQKP